MTMKSAYWKGRKEPQKAFDKKPLKHFVRFSDIHAFQLISEYISGKPLGSTRSAEERSQTIFSLQDTETPYDVLGVEQGASLEEITSAYRKLALENHPDRVAGLADAFRELAEQNMKEKNVLVNRSLNIPHG